MKTGISKEWEIYVTDKRVIFRKRATLGKEIVEASYRHISSIEHKKERPLGYIIAGLVLIALAYLLHASFQEVQFSLLLSVCGVIILITSLSITPSFTIHVFGREPLEMSGRKLGEIIRIIRQYREKMEAVRKG